MISAPFDIPADLDTPVSAFLKLEPLRPRFLLESVEGGERLGRYSFLGFGDADEIRLDATVPEAAGGTSRADAATLLAPLRAALAAAPRLAPAAWGMPFCGGLVGAVGFDATRRLERRYRTRIPRPV